MHSRGGRSSRAITPLDFLKTLETLVKEAELDTEPPQQQQQQSQPLMQQGPRPAAQQQQEQRHPASRFPIHFANHYAQQQDQQLWRGQYESSPGREDPSMKQEQQQQVQQRQQQQQQQPPIQQQTQQRQQQQPHLQQQQLLQQQQPLMQQQQQQQPLLQQHQQRQQQQPSMLSPQEQFKQFQSTSSQQQPKPQQPTQQQPSGAPTPYHLLQQDDQKFWEQQQQQPARGPAPYDFQQQQPVRGLNTYEMQQIRGPSPQEQQWQDRSGATSPASVGYGAASLVTPSGTSYTRHSPRPSSPYQQPNALHLDQQQTAPTSIPTARAPTPSLFQSLIAPPAPTSMQPNDPTAITSLHDIQNQQQQQQPPPQHQQNLTLTTQGALPPRSPTRRQSFGYEGARTGDENRVPAAPYQGISNGYGPPKDQNQTRPQPPQANNPEMALDVAADAHLPQTLQRDPLTADESGYAEEDNRAQALRDMELYRFVRCYFTHFDVMSEIKLNYPSMLDAN